MTDSHRWLIYIGYGYIIRYEKSFVSAPLQINIHYESAAQLAVKRVPERNI